MDLLKQQEELQKEARDLLKETGILDFISKFGEVEIGGSLDSGLMVWRDIDMGVISQKLNEDHYWEMVHFLFNLENYHGLYIQDFRKSVNQRSPKGLYIGLKIKYKENMWKVDAWYIKPREEGDFNFNAWLRDKLNNENRKTILEIKSQVYRNPKYKKEIFSTDIYKGVIENGVSNLEDFKKYLAKTNRLL